MVANRWITATGVFGASAVLLGAMGAHGLKPTSKDTWATASMYHFIHTCALGITAVGISAPKKRNIVCSLFSCGIVLFSGSCYTVAIMNERKPYSYPAPVGGIMLTLGWLALGIL